MLNQFFQQKNGNPFASPIEAPVKELMDLNMRAMQSFSYLMPTELFSMRRPEDMMEKNLEVLIENSHTALAYMQSMFDLMEKHWLKNYEASLKNTKDFSGLVNSSARTATTASTHSVKKATKSASTNVKPSSPSKTKSASAKSATTKSVSTKAETAKKPVAKKATASTMTSTSKTAATKQSSSTASKPSTSSTARPQSAPSAGSSAPQHFSSTSSPAKPMMKESDFHKKI